MVKARQGERLDSVPMVFPGATRRFYDDYSKFVLRELRTSKVWILVHKVVGEQGIELSKVKAVKIMVYPFGTSEDEVTYANHKGVNLMKARCCGRYIPSLKRIEIYPPRFPLALTEVISARRIWGDEDLHYYFFCFEPVGTLVHEYLHVKYKGERTVKKPSRGYMAEFEKSTAGKVEYSHKRSRLSVWLELFIMAHQG